MKKLKTISLIITGLMTFSLLTACGGSTNTVSEKSSGKLTELKVMMFGNKPNGLEEVLAEFEKRTANTLGVRLNIEWSPLADHKERLRMRMSAGEEYDLVFDAPFMNIRTLAPQGAYMPLEGYFQNDKYPGLKKAFPADYINANKMFGHLYGVPLAQQYGIKDSGVFIRKDLREKYGIPEIKDLDGLKKFFDTIKENEHNVIPYAVEGRRGFFELFNQYNDGLDQANIITYRIYGFTVFIHLSDDKKRILHVATIGDPEEKFAGFPAPFNNPERFYAEYNTIVEWNKYLEKDSINQKDPKALFYSGTAAAVEGAMDAYLEIANKVKKNFPNAEVEFYPSYKITRDLVPHSQKTTFAANNFLCVPKTSKKIDKTMAFLNWVYESQENHDLFELGIKGKHWEDAGKGLYRLPSNIDASLNYNFPGYELTWNPTMSRYYAELPENIKAINAYAQRQDTYVKDILTGFQFNVENLKNEVAKVTPVYNAIEPILRNGIDKNPRKVLEDANKKARALGFDKLLDEFIKQLGDFLAKQ